MDPQVHLALTVHGVHSAHGSTKITLHLDRFRSFVDTAYGHDRISTVLARDVILATGTTLRWVDDRRRHTPHLSVTLTRWGSPLGSGHLLVA